jgi:hypothetical protein
MEPEASFPGSQEPSTGPYPQPIPSYNSKIHFNIVHTPMSWSHDGSSIQSLWPTIRVYTELIIMIFVSHSIGWRTQAQQPVCPTQRIVMSIA